MESKARVIESMREHIQSICDGIGPRLPCSEAERRCAEYIRKEWEKHADETCLETFTCHPGAYPATFRWPIALFLLSLGLYPFIPLLSFACSAASTLILVFNLILNRELIDRAFPAKESCNVVAQFDPPGPSDRRLILSCHHDTNFAFPIVNRFGGAAFSKFMTVVVLSSALMTVLTFLRVVFSITGPESLLNGFQKAALPFLVLLAATVPLQIYTFRRVLSREAVPGANDNLSGVAVCLLLAAHLSRAGARPRRTSVWLVSFGCEEFGIRGSKRFVERHRKEIQDAHVLNLDMVGGRGTRLRVISREQTILFPLSARMIRLVEEAARKEGIPLETGPLIAFTDAQAFAVKGIRATSLMALDEKGMVDTYHSMEDIPEHLDLDRIFDSYRLCRAVIEHIDSTDPT